MLQPPHRRIIEVTVIPVEVECLDPRQQLRQHPAGFQTGQMCAEAVVGPTAKRNVLGRVRFRSKMSGSS